MANSFLRAPFLSLKWALFYTFTITCVITSVVVAILFGPRMLHQWRSSQAHYQLTHLLQSPVGQYTLSTPMLSELLDFTVTSLPNLYDCDLTTIAHRVQTIPIFTSLELIKCPPHTLLAQYSLRIPIALLGNYSNTAFDQEGILFPLLPYYNFTELPTVIVADFPPQPWGQQLTDSLMQLLQSLLPSAVAICPTCTIDLRDLEATPLGAITLSLDPPHQKPSHLLRLTKHAFTSELQRYLTLRDELSLWLSPPSSSSLITLDLRFDGASLISLEGDS